MKYGEFLIFDDWNEVERLFFEKMNIFYGVKKGSFERSESTFNVILDNKISKNLFDLIDINKEDLFDYETISPTTKDACFSFPLDKMKAVFESIFGFSGYFKEITSLEQDPTSGTPNTDIYYLKSTLLNDSNNEVISEFIEEKLELVDSSDNSDFIYGELLDLCQNIASVIGNNILKAQIEEKQLDNLLN